MRPSDVARGPGTTLADNFAHVDYRATLSWNARATSSESALLERDFENLSEFASDTARLCSAKFARREFILDYAAAKWSDDGR
jgi:hypothetical protein